MKRHIRRLDEPHYTRCGRVVEPRMSLSDPQFASCFKCLDSYRKAVGNVR